MDPYYLKHMHEVEYAHPYWAGMQITEVSVHARDKTWHIPSAGMVKDMIPIPFCASREGVVIFYAFFGRGKMFWHLPVSQYEDKADGCPVDSIRLQVSDDYYMHRRNTSVDVNIEQCGLLDLSDQVRQRQLYVMGVTDVRRHEGKRPFESIVPAFLYGEETDYISAHDVYSS